MFCDQLLYHCFDTVRVCDVEFDRLDARISLHDGVQMAFAPTRDDHFVAALVQRLGERTANARAAARNEDGVSCEFHDASNLCVSECFVGLAYEGKRSPNMGRPLTDSACVASSCNTSQCSARRPSSNRTTSAAIQAAGLPIPVNRPCAIT